MESERWKSSINFFLNYFHFIEIEDMQPTVSISRKRKADEIESNQSDETSPAKIQNVESEERK